MVSGKLGRLNINLPNTTPNSMWFNPNLEQAEQCILNLYMDYEKYKLDAISLGETNIKKYTYKNILKQYFSNTINKQ